MAEAAAAADSRTSDAVLYSSTSSSLGGSNCEAKWSQCSNSTCATPQGRVELLLYTAAFLATPRLGQQDRPQGKSGVGGTQRIPSRHEKRKLVVVNRVAPVLLKSSWSYARGYFHGAWQEPKCRDFAHGVWAVPSAVLASKGSGTARHEAAAAAAAAAAGAEKVASPQINFCKMLGLCARVPTALMRASMAGRYLSRYLVLRPASHGQKC
jgi:hypothetical protein